MSFLMIAQNQHNDDDTMFRNLPDLVIREILEYVHYDDIRATLLALHPSPSWNEIGRRILLNGDVAVLKNTSDITNYVKRVEDRGYPYCHRKIRMWIDRETTATSRLTFARKFGKYVKDLDLVIEPVPYKGKGSWLKTRWAIDPEFFRRFVNLEAFRVSIRFGEGYKFPSATTARGFASLFPRMVFPKVKRVDITYLGALEDIAPDGRSQITRVGRGLLTKIFQEMCPNADSLLLEGPNDLYPLEMESLHLNGSSGMLNRITHLMIGVPDSLDEFEARSQLPPLPNLTYLEFVLEDEEELQAEHLDPQYGFGAWANHVMTSYAGTLKKLRFLWFSAEEWVGSYGGAEDLDRNLVIPAMKNLEILEITVDGYISTGYFRRQDQQGQNTPGIMVPMYNLKLDQMGSIQHQFPALKRIAVGAGTDPSMKFDEIAIQIGKSKEHILQAYDQAMFEIVARVWKNLVPNGSTVSTVQDIETYKPGCATFREPVPHPDSELRFVVTETKEFYKRLVKTFPNVKDYYWLHEGRVEVLKEIEVYKSLLLGNKGKIENQNTRENDNLRGLLPYHTSRKLKNGEKNETGN